MISRRGCAELRHLPLTTIRCHAEGEQGVRLRPQFLSKAEPQFAFRVPAQHQKGLFVAIDEHRGIAERGEGLEEF